MGELLAHYWWLLIFGAALAVYVRYLAGMAKTYEERMDTERIAGAVQRATRAEDETPAPFRRAEFAARYAQFRRRAPGFLFHFGPSVVACAAVWLFKMLGPAIDFDLWTASLWIGISLAFVMLPLGQLRTAKLLRVAGLRCPACGAELGIGTAERVLVGGRCACGVWLIHPSELPPEAPPAAPTPRWRHVVDLIVLLSVTVGALYYGCHSLASR